ncbi:ATP phosphoribosyltransferase [Lysobacter sp. HX-5-24]|uniref:ATP phosphoribosyltransferase n=1 Tax=Noviluteimonas gilva TaxID=2682097 RepID=A0A7C9I5Z4_9GAMM|nr:ATP phosphoribosyltransferase [Lysobacter gilvus]
MPLSAPSGAMRERVRIAIQKSGRLAEPARALLSSCGLSWRESRDRLFCHGDSTPIDLLLVRDDDIPGLLAEGTCDLGIVGRNVLLERASGYGTGEVPPFREWRGLGFGACRLALAVPQAWSDSQAAALDGLRIATSYPALVSQWLKERGIAADVVTLSGSVEIAPRLGTADLICDIVSSGATLAANQLRATDIVLDSEAVLAGPVAPFGDARAEIAGLFLRRLDAVLGLRDSKLLMFQTDSANVPALMALLPDAERPTVMQVDGTDRVALQAVCRGTVTWQRLEDLKRAGADALLVLPVERMLA